MTVRSRCLGISPPKRLTPVPRLIVFTSYLRSGVSKCKKPTGVTGHSCSSYMQGRSQWMKMYKACCRPRVSSTNTTPDHPHHLLRELLAIDCAAGVSFRYNSPYRYKQARTLDGDCLVRGIWSWYSASSKSLKWHAQDGFRAAIYDPKPPFSRRLLPFSVLLSFLSIAARISPYIRTYRNAYRTAKNKNQRYENEVVPRDVSTRAAPRQFVKENMGVSAWKQALAEGLLLRTEPNAVTPFCDLCLPVFWLPSILQVIW